MEVLALGRTARLMGTREIAKLYDKPHNDTLKKVRKLEAPYVEAFGAEGNFSHSTYRDENNQERPEIMLNKSQALFVASRFDAVLHARVQKRWEELEEKQVSLPNFSDPAAAAIAWAEQYKRAQIAEQTKAEIGSRREATSMNTASQATKRANKLEVELDRSKEYCTIKRMSMLNHGQKFDWRLLKSTSKEMDCPAVDVFDANYGTVKAYHADVWLEAYAIEIEGKDEA